MLLRECQVWEQDALLPLAQQRIELDLDDGVKVNYLKLQDVLAPIPGLAAFTGRLMTAHDDPAVDAQALQQLLPVDREALFDLLVDLLAIDGHADPRETEALARLAEKLGLPPRPLEQLL